MVQHRDPPVRNLAQTFRALLVQPLQASHSLGQVCQQPLLAGWRHVQHVLQVSFVEQVLDRDRALGVAIVERDGRIVAVGDNVSPVLQAAVDEQAAMIRRLLAEGWRFGAVGDGGAADEGAVGVVGTKW